MQGQSIIRSADPDPLADQLLAKKLYYNEPHLAYQLFNLKWIHYHFLIKS